jgi:site-specific recombinase XerD
VLTKADIQDYLIDVRDRNSDSTVQVRYRSLHRLYSWAEKEELIGRSPMAGMSLPKAEQKLIPVPARDDLRKLLAACSGDDFDAVRDTATWSPGTRSSPGAARAGESPPARPRRP